MSLVEPTSPACPARQAEHPEAVPALSASEQARLGRMADESFSFVWRLLRRMGLGAADLDDATQQVFLVACRRLGSIRAGAERPFLFGVALRVCAEFRRRRTDVPVADLEPAARGSEPGVDELVERLRARAALDAILDSMSEEQRTVFVLFELEQLTKSEIAALTGWPEGTVMSRLRRAREIFEACLKRRQAARQPRRVVP